MASKYFFLNIFILSIGLSCTDKIEEQKKLFELGKNNLEHGEFYDALNYFNQIKDTSEFESYSKYKNDCYIALDLIKHLPGDYKGNATPYIGGSIWFYNTRMKIWNNKEFLIKEAFKDNLSGYSALNEYRGTITPRLIRLNNENALELVLSTSGKPYRKNDFRLYFYRDGNYWRIQFNLTYGFSDDYVLSVIKEVSPISESSISKTENQVNAEVERCLAEWNYSMGVFDFQKHMQFYGEFVIFFGELVNYDYIFAQKSKFFNSGNWRTEKCDISDVKSEAINNSRILTNFNYDCKFIAKSGKIFAVNVDKRIIWKSDENGWKIESEEDVKVNYKYK